MSLLSALPPAPVEFKPLQGFNLPEILIVLGAMGGLTLVLVFWAAFIRKRRRRRSLYDYPATHADLRSSDSHGSGDRKHRRRRRPHRPRNPTRAETGGLPRVRQREAEKNAA